MFVRRNNCLEQGQDTRGKLILLAFPGEVRKCEFMRARQCADSGSEVRFQFFHASRSSVSGKETPSGAADAGQGISGIRLL
jgi:hypothetical protein